jgi:D-inositol-3-phosphate glycosyltransferase
MKIIIIGPAYPFRGGIADTNESLCQTLNELGHDASLVTFTIQYPNFLFPGKTQYSEDPKPEKLEITRLIHSINPFSWFKTAKRINRQNPDLVLIRYWIPVLSPSLGTIARLIKKGTTKIAMCDNVIPHEKRMGDIALTKYF